MLPESLSEKMVGSKLGLAEFGRFGFVMFVNAEIIGFLRELRATFATMYNTRTTMSHVDGGLSVNLTPQNSDPIEVGIGYGQADLFDLSFNNILFSSEQIENVTVYYYGDNWFDFTISLSTGVRIHSCMVPKEREQATTYWQPVIDRLRTTS